MIEWREDYSICQGEIISELSKQFVVKTLRKNRRFIYNKFYDRVPGVYRSYQEKKFPMIITSWREEECSIIFPSQIIERKINK